MPPASGARYAVGVPASDAFAAALLHRLRCLDRVERTILMRASAIGRRFCLTVLSATAQMAEERVRAVLEKACVLQFVVREGEGGDWYAFRHALIRDVAYREFVASRLRAIHRRIARALERCDSPHHALDDLAYHSWIAGDAARSCRYNELAGDRAAAAFAAGEAQTYYARAREFIAPDSAKHRRLSSKIAALERQSGEQRDCSTRSVQEVRRTPR